MDNGDWAQGLLYALATGVLLVAGCLALFWRPYHFLIYFQGDHFEFKGKFPQARRRLVTEFLEEDLRLRRPCKIMGAWHGQKLQVWFRGDLIPGEKQRIRNFLMLRLS
jgi:hypothetical protein